MSSILPPLGPSERRAASAIVGLILLFGMVMVGAGLILMASMSATEQVQQQNELDNAELSLQEASVRLQTLSYQDDDDVASFDLAGRSSDDVRIESNGNLTFQLNGEGACTARMELGSIVYRNDEGQSVAYQAGGVWRDDGDGVSLVSPPGLTYQTEQVDNRTVRSVDFPVVNVQGDLNSASGEVTARQVDNPGGPNMEQQLCLPVSENSTIDRVRTVSITVENNTYYEAWERYLDAELGSSVMHKDVDHDNRTVRYRVPLGEATTPSEFTVDDAEIPAAVWGTSGATMEFEKLPTPGYDTKVDSYDSSVAPYTVASGSNATVVNNGPLTLHGGSKILGDVAADGDVTVDGGSNSNPTRVDGSISYNGTNSTPPTPNTWEVTGTFSDGFEFNGNQVPPPDADIDYTIDSASQVNHNNETPVFNASFSDGVRQSGTVETGVYFVENLQVDNGEPLTFDTSDGDIVVAVNRSVDVGERVEVHGDGQVRLFVQDDVTIDDEVKVFGTSATPTNESRRLWTFAQSGADITLEPGARYTGVVYAPGASETRLESLFSGPNSVRSELFGALIGGETVVEEGSQVHFDMDVQTSSLDSDGDGVPDSSDSNNTVPDSDQDDVPNSYDDCPNGDQTDEGVNGCLSVTEDESANALVVNQSRAQLTIVGSMVADNRTRTREVGEREPLDVEFLLDDSGSMVSYLTHSWQATGDWSGWERVGPGRDTTPGTYQVPANERWQVQEYQCWFWCGWTNTRTYDPGETVTLEDDNRYHTSPTQVTVSPGEAWELRNPDNGQTTWMGPGSTVDTSVWSEYKRAEADVGDPLEVRADATQSFIGALDSSKDNVGIFEFAEESGPDYEETHRILAEGSDFTGANNSFTLVADGGTNIAQPIDAATNRLRNSPNEEKVIVLLTDGQHNVDHYPGIDQDEEVEYAAEQAHDEGITIYTVALGDDTNEGLLTDIAVTNDDATNGSFHKANDYSELVGIFDQIAGKTTEQQYNVIEYKNTTVDVNVGGTNYPISLNANRPTNSSHPSTTIDIASLQGASDDELEEYVGTLLSAEVTTRSCQNVSTFNNVTAPDGDEYAEVTCDGTSGSFDNIDNGSHSDHEIYVDGDSVPSNANFSGGWFKDQTFGEVIDQYESDTGETLVDDSTNTFDIGQNDAVIVVRTNSSGGDTDYVVMHFEALDTVIDYDVNASTNTGYDPDSDTYSSEDDNSYVIDIDQSNVELGNESASIVALPGDVVDRAVTGDAGGTPTARLVPSQSGASAARARSAV